MRRRLLDELDAESVDPVDPVLSRSDLGGVPRLLEMDLVHRELRCLHWRILGDFIVVDPGGVLCHYHRGGKYTHERIRLVCESFAIKKCSDGTVIPWMGDWIPDKTL
jgi:hypothetical protein